MIKILIAEDSPTDAAILKHIFESDPGLSVVACACDGLEAVEMAEKFKPDLITMDIKMPKMDGYDAIAQIMSKFPIPIVVISSMINDSESDATFLSLAAGALTVLPKPVDIQSPGFERTRRNIIDTVKSMSEIKVITKRRITPRIQTDAHLDVTPQDYKIVVIGSSVGGPQALKEILSRLPSNFPIPIVAVQHMTRGFIGGFTKWMDGHVGLRVKLAEDGELLSPGVVYFAPDSNHLQIVKHTDTFRASLLAGPPVSGFCPSITVLMKSVAKHAGNKSVGILLTGMGSDGADGMLTMKQGGAHTLIQDPDSCVVFGMASVAKSLGAVDKVVNLDKIAEYLIRITNKKRQDPN